LRNRDLPEILHAVTGEQIEGVPGFLIELNALAGHGGHSSIGAS
jgi:hypothetical protein